MSLWDDQDIACPGCGMESSYRVWTSLNAQIDPQARQQLLDDELLVFKCPHCDRLANIVHPLLYHDMKHRFMVQLCFDGSTPPDPPPMVDFDISEYRFRAVDSVLELKEKILVFEAGCDDRVVELFKAYMEHQDRKGQYPPGCRTMFRGFQQNKKGLEILIVVLTDQCNYVAYPFRKYEAVHHNTRSMIDIEQAEQKSPHAWRRIDRAYARQMLHYS